MLTHTTGSNIHAGTTVIAQSRRPNGQHTRCRAFRNLDRGPYVHKVDASDRRRNWLHMGSKEAGPRIAAIFSVVESCRRLGLPIRRYLLATSCRGSPIDPYRRWLGLHPRPMQTGKQNNLTPVCSPKCSLGSRRTKMPRAAPSYKRGGPRKRRSGGEDWINGHVAEPILCSLESGKAAL
jgi:hypothetical protein